MSYNLMETQARLSRHNKFISAENIIAILSVSSDYSLHASLPYTLTIVSIDDNFDIIRLM